VLARDTALLKNANRDKQRYENLFKQNAISPQQRDTVATNADVLAATVAVDKAAVETAQLDLGYTHIRSPIDGKTGPLLMHPGDMVAAAGNTAMVTIAQLRPIKLSFNLPQSDFPRIRTRQQLHPLIAVIDQHDSQGRSLSAPVNFTSNEVNNQSGTIELRADFDNTDLSLLPGQVANVTVELDIIPKALVVPHDALNDGPNGAYVYKIVNNHAEPRSVKILFDDSKNAAVQGPIRPGDEVITEGQLRVVPGGAVKIFSSAKTPDNARARTNGGGIGGAMNGPG
jgi:multidrug efflux system membrane fusion protein